jgi:hypothetical protein
MYAPLLVPVGLKLATGGELLMGKERAMRTKVVIGVSDSAANGMLELLII